MRVMFGIIAGLLFLGAVAVSADDIAYKGGGSVRQPVSAVQPLQIDYAGILLTSAGILAPSVAASQPAHGPAAGPETEPSAAPHFTGYTEAVP